MEKRSVMSHYRSRKISGTQQSFLTEMAICIAERWKKVWVTILFLNAIMHRKVIHVNFFCFFSVILARPQFVEIQKICHYGNMT